MARNYSTEFSNMGWPSPYSGIPAYSPMPPSCIGFPYHPSVNLHYPLAPSCGTYTTRNVSQECRGTCSTEMVLIQNFQNKYF